MNAPRLLLTAALVAVTLAVPGHASARPVPLYLPGDTSASAVQPSGRWPHRPTVLGTGHLVKPAQRTEPRPQHRRPLTCNRNQASARARGPTWARRAAEIGTAHRCSPPVWLSTVQKRRAHEKDKHMLAQQTTTNPANAALNIAELADRYTGLLHGIGRRYRLTPEECDDAAQSTWLALCQHADRIRDPQRIPGWLATTMRRFCAAAIRRRHREQPASHLAHYRRVRDRRPGRRHRRHCRRPAHNRSGSIRPSPNYPTGNDASSNCNSTQRNPATRRSAAPYPCPWAASARSAAAPCAACEPSSTTSNNHKCPVPQAERSANIVTALGASVAGQANGSRYLASSISICR